MSKCSFRAAGKRKSNQGCHNISISSRQWWKEGQILPVLQVTGTGCLALVPSHKHCAVLGTNRGGCVLQVVQSRDWAKPPAQLQWPGPWHKALLAAQKGSSQLPGIFFFSDLVHLGSWTLQSTWCESGPAAHAAPKAASPASLSLLEAPRSHLCGPLPLISFLSTLKAL